MAVRDLVGNEQFTEAVWGFLGSAAVETREWPLTKDRLVVVANLLFPFLFFPFLPFLLSLSFPLLCLSLVGYRSFRSDPVVYVRASGASWSLSVGGGVRAGGATCRQKLQTSI